MRKIPSTKNDQQETVVHRTFRFCSKLDVMLDNYSAKYGKYKSFVVETAISEYLDLNEKVAKNIKDDCNDEMIKRTYVITKELDERLNTYCIRNGVSKSFVVERSLERYLKII